MLLILILALFLRWYGINWDQGWHLHPDERMLIMVADKIHLFSQMNPEFFNYGSLPIYVLKGVSQIISRITSTNAATYDSMLGIGRGISVTLDLTVLILVWKTSLLLFDSKKTAVFAALLYAIAFFPIQNTHFFIVDNFLNVFMTAIMYVILRQIKSPSFGKIIILAVLTAAAVTTKATGIILILPAGLAVILNKNRKISKYILKSILQLSTFGFVLILFSYLFMPYAFSGYFNLNEFVRNPMSVFNLKLVDDVTLQIKMNSDPFIFPYTLQYVKTIPYLYYLKNIFLWGLGPFISILSVFGSMLYLLTIIKSFKNRHDIRRKITKLISVLMHLRKSDYKVRSETGLTPYFILLMGIYLIFYIFYFLLIGRSAVKFMRYMLPLYAPLCVLGGFAIYEFLTYFHPSKFKPTSIQIKIKPYINGIGILLLGGALIWTIMFEQIYSIDHTRITASRWIYQNIPQGSTIAVEHWDDRLPLPFYDFGYQFNELTLYDPDSTEKWNTIKAQLEESDYLIIASNRLYTPLMKLTDCDAVPPHRCFRQTADYYKKLFSGSLGFEKAAEFSRYPRLQIGKFALEIPDDNADESFTVYDHPKIMIFKKSEI